ncbi:hypothetical protein K4F52_004275 [Lecanicillium sp. MT-2017a]|nr:hypothetical protein K4F52_004275 [Lecanicillium sp. MT-2017a]
MPAKHQAAILTAIGSPLTVVERDTPEPGHGEVLVEARAVAFNPVDWYQRDHGTPPVPLLPAVLASDVAGVVAKVGPGLSTAPAVGSRVIALASAYYHAVLADYGAAQKYVLTRAERITPLPDTMSFEQGAVLPLATLTALSAYTTLDIPLRTKHSPEDRQSFLVWGGSSSVGSMAVQSARAMGYVVYATAGAKNLDYVASLGAAAVFDHKDPDVVSQIVSRAKQDGTELRTAHVAVPNALQPTLDVIRQTKGDKTAKVAHAPLLPADVQAPDGVEVKFTFPPTDPDEKKRHMRECFGVWLDASLRAGDVVPSPKVEVVPGGLGGVNEALDRLRSGVSATKLVILL